MNPQWAILMAVLTTNAYAMCYAVYDQDNVLVYESTKSPVPTNSLSMHDAVTKRFPGSSMMIDHRVCPHFELKGSKETAKTMQKRKSLWPPIPSSESHRGDIARIVVVPNAGENVVEASVTPNTPAAIAPVPGVQQSAGNSPQVQQQTRTPQPQAQVLEIHQPQFQVETTTVQIQTAIIGQPIRQNQKEMQLRKQQDFEKLRLIKQSIAQENQKYQQVTAQGQKDLQEIIQRGAAFKQSQREQLSAQLPDMAAVNRATEAAGMSRSSYQTLMAQREAAIRAEMKAIK